MTSQARSHERATIASTIDRLMVRESLTNAELARRIGSTEHQVWRWRRGRVRPSQRNLAALAFELADGDIGVFLVSESQRA